MIRNDYTIELPVDADEAVKRLQHELHEAKRRRAEARRATSLEAFRPGPAPMNVGGRS
jgi:hypothetical protein